jgi:hypothetical protein
VIRGVSWLVVWAGVGVFAGWRLFRRQLLEPAASAGGGAVAAGADPAAGAVGGIDPVLDRLLSPKMAAVIAKDLRYLLRSTLGKLALVFAPVIAVIGGLAFAKPAGAPVFGIDVSELTFLGIFLYASVLVSNFVINSFAWDGNGVASYFLAPVGERTVLAGKNLAVWVFSVVLAVECFAAWSVTQGVPNPATALSGLLIFAATILCLMIVGNFTSVAFPVRRLISSANNSPSQTAVLIMLAVVVVNGLLTGAMIVVADLTAGAWLRPVVLLVYVAGLAAAYAAFLQPAAVLLRTRREKLAKALEGGEQG